MKKITLSIAAALAFCFGVTTSKVQAESATIIAAQNYTIGSCTFFADQSYLYLYVYIDPSWKINSLKFQPAVELSEFKLNNAGNPQTGQFDYNISDSNKIVLSGYTLYTITIPRSSLSNPNALTVCGALHAKVTPDNVEGVTGAQTAWAGDLDFGGSNWGTYFCLGIQGGGGGGGDQ